MSGAQDKIEEMFENHHERLFRFLSLKVDVQTAEDLCQHTFMKAMENLHSFRGNSSHFSWLCTIALNSLKNEYRRKSNHLQVYGHSDHRNADFVTVAFAENVDIRIDIQSALQRLNAIDREIILMHYDTGCTLKEISEIIGMRLSTVKNRVYRALARLRNELHDWEVRRFMSVIDYIEVVSNKSPGNSAYSHQDKTVYMDIIQELKTSVDRISALIKHKPSRKVTIEIYPDLPSFHQSVGEPDAPAWFMGTFDGDTLKIASPLKPGPEHTYESILKSTVHLFTMWLVSDLNPSAPKWLRQGLGGCQAQLMTEEYIDQSIREWVVQNRIPSFEDLEDNTWAFETMKGFQFSYKLCEYVIQTFGPESLHKIIRDPSNFIQAFGCSESEFYEQWVAVVKNRYK